MTIRIACPACDKDMGLKPPAATEHHGRRGSHGEGEEGMSLKSITEVFLAAICGLLLAPILYVAIIALHVIAELIAG